MVTEAKTTNYWISNSALYIQLNATGEPNRIQASVVSGASILCYMQGIDGLGYDAGHNYQRWTLAAYPSEFPSDEKRYVYVAIPRKRTSGNDIATVVFPSQKIDIYGKAIVLNTDEEGKQEEVVGDQIGSEDYYYIYLQGIISEVYLNNANDRVRKWVQDVDFGSLSTDEALASGGVAQWWKYNSVSDTVTFLKTIFSATFDSLVAKTISVKELFFGKKKITGIASDQSQEDSEEEIVTPKYLKKYGGGKYLSKVNDDTANGLINFAKGLIVKAVGDLAIGASSGYSAKLTELGEAFFSAIKSLDYDNAAEQGFSVEKEKNGKYHAFFTNLTIWGKARFHELEVRKLSYSGGNIYLSGAGSKLIKVVPVKKLVSADGVTTWVEMTEDDAESECAGWKCYLLADDGTTATMNYWQEGDQVRCQTMGEIAAGGAYSDVSNKSYWRTIPNGGVSTQNEKIYGTKTETYLDEDGNEQTREVQVELYDGQAFAWIVIGKHCDGIDGYDDEFSVGYNGSNPAPLETRDIPSSGDTIVLDGNRHRNGQQEYDKTDRQNVIILETTGEYAPRIACYANITEYKHTFTKSVNGSNKEVSLSVFETSPNGGTKINSSRFEWISDDGSTINIINYRGDWEENNTYHKNDQVNHNNAVWVCVANSGVDVQEEPSDGKSNWKKVLSGVKGDDGKTPQPTGSAETYYAITSSPSTEPDDSSWTITPIDTSKHQGKFLWTDNRTEWKIGDKTEWISNKTCSYIGKDGSNGTSVSIKGSLSGIGELPVSGNVNGDSYLIDGYLWIYTGTSVDDDNHYNGFENVGKIKGEDGISATQYYYHVAWMNTSDNSDSSFTTTNPSGSSYAYIGTLIDTTENDSDDYTKYDWAYVKGDKGDEGPRGLQGLQGPRGEQGVPGTDGKNGATSYFHIKYSEVANPTVSSQMSETPNTYIGTYVDFTETDSTDPKKYTWHRFEGLQGPQGEQGIPGVGIDGKTTYLHIKYSNDGGKTFTSNNGETVGDYIGVCTDFNANDPTIVSSYKWSKTKGDKGDKGDEGPRGLQGLQGPRGEQGVPGTDGKNGATSYFHIKYSEVANPTVSSQMSETPNTYIGTYVDFTETDSTDPKKYTWHRFEGLQGPQGEQGIPGVGIDGKTTYLHIKYSNDGGKTFTANNGETVGDYIGVCTDFNANDPTSVSSYKWSKTKGEKGEKGDEGPRGLQGLQGPRGEQGIPGTDGKNGATSYFHIKYSAVAKPTVSSQMSETPNTYIGTYVDFTETDSTDPKKYTWHRFEGLQGPQGEQGIPGVGIDGNTTYLHIKYSNDGGKTFTANNGETVGDYIGVCTDFNANDPTSVSSYKWSKTKGDKGDKGDEGPRGLQGLQGPRGEQGIPGTDGKNGATSYFHIKYSAVAKPTVSSQMSETPNTYIGTYVDFTETDSTDPKKYTWHRFEGQQGPQGEQGIPGVGIDGKTTYLHIKYSNDGGKTFTANNGETVGDYIGVCTDFNANDPTSVSSYKWSKTKGDKGDKGEEGPRGLQGLQGPRGEQGIPGTDGKNGATSYFHIKYSAVAEPTVSSQMSETPNTYIGTYVDFTETDSTDPKKYTWHRFEGLQGPQGEQGIPGVGIDGKTTYLHIKYSNDGGKTFTANNGETVGDYIGVCTDFNANDPTSVSSYKWSKTKGDKGEKGDEGPRGEQGESALEIIVTPETLVFDTNDYGLVPPETSKQASISCYRNGVKVTNVSYSKSAEKNCSASVSESNSSATVTISRITSQEVTDDKGNSSTISNTSGYATIQVWDKDTNLYHRVQVKFMVNVAKFTGQMVNTNKRFSNTLQEVSTSVDDKMDKFDLNEFKAEITQTAREISLSVSEKSIGRRNLLVGSAFLREDNHYTLSRDTRIEMNSGYNGTNCIKVIDDTDGTSHYIGVYWDGSQGGRSVKIEKGKKYTISCYYKTNDSNAKFSLEAIYTDKETNAKRLGRPKYLSPSSLNPKYNQWELFKTVIDTTDAESDYIAFNFWEYCNVEAGIINAYICRPMVEEGDTYNGWTLSQDDYDYVGGNMLDNTLSLDKSGSLYDVNGTLTPAGFGESTSIYKSFTYKLKGTVDSFSQLPSSGNVYNDTYYVRNDGTCYAYNGSEFIDVGNDYYYNVLEWRKGKSGSFTPFGLEANKDYVFSFMAKGTGLLTAYFYSPETDVFIESSLGATNISVDGGTSFQLTNKWERYWVHWRPSDSLHKYVLLRLNRSIQSDKGDAPKTDCYIAQPKLEEGARVTEYTERKSDLVDKASLKAAGIEITSDMVELYGNQVKVSGAKGGTPVAMFENGMLNSNLINADKIMARQLQTTGSNGQSVSIENGLMRVYGTNGRCNIEFGVNSNGEAILSYFDKDGKWLYDLGPNKLDGGQLAESKLDGEKYVDAVSFFGTNNFFTSKTYINVAVKQVNSEYSERLFGNNLFSNDDQEIENNNAAHMGYKPFERVSSSDVTTLYRYTAPRQSGTIIKDERYGLTTPALAKQADGKYFTDNSKLAINGQLTNLAHAGYYFRQSEKVMMAPHPMPSEGTQPVRFPAYSIRWLKITKDSTGTVMIGFNAMMSYLMNTIKIQI